MQGITEWQESPDTLYIGRKTRTFERSKWANPFRLSEFDWNREHCLALYEKYARRTELYDQLHELANKEIGCWCDPLPCHGHVLQKLFFEKHAKTSNL